MKAKYELPDYTGWNDHFKKMTASADTIIAKEKEKQTEEKKHE